MNEVLSYDQLTDEALDLDSFDNFLVKDKKRIARRRKNITKALRKRSITRQYGVYDGTDWYNNLHQYSKNKIHCSCQMCAFNNKRARRKEYTLSDLKKLEYVRSQLDDWAC